MLRRALSSSRTEATPGAAVALHRLAARQCKSLLWLEFLTLRQKSGGESLAFADSLDFDCSRFHDLLDAGDSRHQLRIPGRRQCVALAATLAEEVGAGKRTGENGDAGENGNQRDQ